MKPTEEELERVARELYELSGAGLVNGWKDLTRTEADMAYVYARDAWNVIAPLVLERAARVCETTQPGISLDTCCAFTVERQATEIRALKDEG